MNRIGYKITKPGKKRIRPANGIRRKIRYGFVILGLLLLFSGVVSYLELSRLSRTTRELMDASIKDLDLSKRMLDAVNKQNAAVFLKISKPTENDIPADSVFRNAELTFNQTFQEAFDLHLHTQRLERIQTAKNDYDRVLYTPQDSIADPMMWYNRRYRIAYYDLALTVKDFMIESQNTIDHNTVVIQNNAYRAIMPGIITLLIALIIIFIFYGLIDNYYIKPVLKVKQGLENYLNNRIPYTVQVEGRDEVKELNDQIETLVAMTRKKTE